MATNIAELENGKVLNRRTRSILGEVTSKRSRGINHTNCRIEGNLLVVKPELVSTKPNGIDNVANGSSNDILRLQAPASITRRENVIQ